MRRKDFNKPVGCRHRGYSQPGDFIYFGRRSSTTTSKRHRRHPDGPRRRRRRLRGVLESDYNVSTLEPVITGPDFTDESEDANDALRNIANVTRCVTVASSA